MAENQIAIGLDLSKTPLRVGGLVNKNTGRIIVIQGSEAAKVTGDETPGRGELVKSYREAREIVNSSMGGGDIAATVIVVPNATNSRNRDVLTFLDSHNRDGVINVVQVVSEYTAVAAAYAASLKPNKPKTLAVISTTGDILDVCVVSVKPKDLLNEIYEYDLAAQKAQTDHIDFDEVERQRLQTKKEEEAIENLPKIGKLLGALSKNFAPAVDALRDALSSPELKNTSPVDAVVFAGDSSTPKALQKAVDDVFPNAKVWDGIDPDEVAAYGGAVLAFNKTTK